MTQTQWQTICSLTEAARQAEEARLSSWLRREAEILQAIDRLDDNSGQDLMADPVAHRAGADLRWQVWCDRRRSELLAELAQIRYRKQAASEEMQLAARRCIATAAVLRDARNTRLRRACLRAQREGQG